MLTLLLGTDWVANRQHIMEMIAQDVAQEKDGRILLVPELISHDSERRLCFCAGDTASRFAEVLSFTRLAERVSNASGHAICECMDNGGRVVAMAAAAQQMHSRLKAYAAVETQPEFLSGLLDAVDEFKRCCVTAKDLMIASSKAEGSLAQKLEELSVLLDAYDSLCARGKRDPRDQMTWLLEELEDGNFAQNRVFYIDGFPDFNRQQIAIIEHLIRRAENVFISLTCDEPGSRKLAFERAGQTALELMKVARKANVTLKIQQVVSENEALGYLHNRLFQGTIDKAIPKNNLCVYRTETVYDECLAAAENVLDLIANGARYRDINVVYSDMTTYRTTLEMVFDRCKIPLYLSGTDDILSTPVISSFLAAVDTAMGGFEQQDVLQYLKSIISPLSLDVCDMIENYAVIWNINGSHWLQDWTDHPDGLGQQDSVDSLCRLNKLNDARREAIEPLKNLRDHFRKATNIREQVSALHEFLEQIRLAVRLDALAQQMDRNGDFRTAQILNQLWDILLNSLDQLCDVLGRSSWDADSFTRLLRLLLSQYDVGTIPPVLDAVSVGSADDLRCQQARHLILLGASEGSLPGYGSLKGVLTDLERSSLREMGVPLNGGAIDRLQAEFAEIYGVFTGVSDSATVSCPGGQPSFVYNRLCQLAGGEVVNQEILGAALRDPIEASAYLARFDDHVAAKDLGIEAQYSAVQNKKHHILGTVDQENVQKLYGEKLRLSASQVDKLAECRMSYFLRYGLRTKELKPAAIDPAEFGTYVHAVLENTARKIKEMGGFSKVSLDATVQIAKDYSKLYMHERFRVLSSERIQYLFNRNTQELELIVKELWNELNKSKFQPADFEVAFGDGEAYGAISVSGHLMDAQLRGFVDRVDTYTVGDSKYFRVVDYKTGRKDFDYCDLFNGIGLQMLLYLFALEDNGASLVGENAIPAGVQYFPARVPLVSADGNLSDEEAATAREKLWKRKGLLLADEQVLQAMESEDAPNRMPYTVKKDGTISGDLANSQQFKTLKTYVFRLLGKLVDQVADGTIAANPYTRGSSHDACAFCPYSAVCHSLNIDGRRNYKTMTAERFWDEVYKEVSDHG